jgi:hypothetical protein
MATQIAVNDMLAARYWFVLNEQAAVCTFNYQAISAAGAGVTDQDLANKLDTDFNIFWKDLVPPAVTYRGVQIYFRNRGVGVYLPAPVSAGLGSGVGTATNPPVPRVACLMMKYRTVIRGPGGRGRLYFPFVSNDFVASNGRPTVAYGVLVNSAAANFLLPYTVTVGVNSTTLVWVLLRNHFGALPTVTGQIVNAEASDRIGQMHKRGDFGRANSSPI